MTFDEATGRWWNEVGQHLKQSRQVEQQLEALVKLVGGGVMLSEISTDRVAQVIERRRAMLTRGKLPKAITVNNTVIGNLRRILRRAATTWEVAGLRQINWTALRLPEPKPQPREFSADELDRLEAALPDHCRDFMRFAARYGCRHGEMFFALDALDLVEGRLTLRDRKAGDGHQIPLLKADLAMLAARSGRARAAGLDTVWFRPLKGGKLKAMTYKAMSGQLDLALIACGLKASKGARIHDLRHHAATQILRQSGNLKVAQRLLGHASIQSTTRYAHAVDGDLRAGLEAVELAAQAAPAKPAKPAKPARRRAK